MADSTNTANVPSPPEQAPEIAPAPKPFDTDKSPKEALQEMVTNVEMNLADPAADKLPKAAEDNVRAVLTEAKHALEGGSEDDMVTARQIMIDALQNAAAAYNATIDPTAAKPKTEPYGSATVENSAPNPHSAKVEVGPLPAQDSEPEMVTMLFPHLVRLRVSSDQVLVFQQGIQQVPAQYADHKYLAANGVKRPEAKKHTPLPPTPSADPLKGALGAK